jgi:hypothetical protein
LAALALLSPTAARSAPLLILEQDCCGTAARPWTMADHLAYIDTLPFDGISLNIPFTWGGLNPGPTYGYAAIMSQLAPVAGKLTKVNKNFVKVAVRRCADVFDDWAGRLCFQHWKDLADAARDSGMVGIMFDNEEYDAGSQVWNYPADVKYGATRTLAQYREQARSRGKQVMWTLQAEWPAVRVVHFHGPYSSDARVPGAPCANDGRDTRDLRGYFFAGMLEAAGSSARVVDGGECYNLRSTTTSSSRGTGGRTPSPRWPATRSSRRPCRRRGRRRSASASARSTSRGPGSRWTRPRCSGRSRTRCCGPTRTAWSGSTPRATTT